MRFCLQKELKNFLYPVSWIYDFVIRFWQILYKFQILKNKKLNKPVISIGNLSMGGSGKTPFTIWLSNEIKKQNPQKKIFILTRGYKRQNNTCKPIEVKKDSRIEDVGDEPKMMFEAGLNVLVSSNRVEAGIFAENYRNPDLFILDDGFQHLKLHRDINICLIDCSDKLTLDLFPVGSLRESFSNISRADFVILTRTNIYPEFAQKVKNRVLKYIYENKIFELIEKGSTEYPSINKLKVFAFCGIGNPEQFKHMLKNDPQIDLQGFHAFPDHYEYKNFSLNVFKKLQELFDFDYFITTQKDAIKLQDFENLLIYKSEISEIKDMSGMEVDFIEKLFQKK